MEYQRTMSGAHVEIQTTWRQCI